MVPRALQIALRRQIALFTLNCHRNDWPIGKNSNLTPRSWKSWPENKKFALILTHDVDTIKGHEKCMQLMDLEIKLGFRSSFNFVPERYQVLKELRGQLIDKGFEVGVHGLNHDGKLFSTKKIFEKRAAKINEYLYNWGSVGFRSPAMHHNLNWIHELNIEYDASTFDIDPFEPQSDGVNTIFPFWVPGKSNNDGYVELPYTLPQDFTLFILLREKFIDIWKQKLDWIITNGGMALINTHPDYMNFEESNYRIEEYPYIYYSDFLQYIKYHYSDQYWHVLPKEITKFWKASFAS